MNAIQGHSREISLPNEVLEVDKKTLPSTWELNDHRLKTSETFVLLKAQNVTLDPTERCVTTALIAR
ncbi:hypothetical protein HID58_037742 [Brassica napus]|uniref:Uncharacterized protein n=1 Tax=Brassica napus TaxID=3708 RepID=A0ABQ8BM76_BRANA|nr:hypothetical protein HID58_037742 [Brassica napus]